MRWLIIEDSLKSRKGHWFEYIQGFVRMLPVLGDQVSLLVQKDAEEFIVKGLTAQPILPDSPYLNMNDGAPAWKRYARIPMNAWKIFWVLSKHLRQASLPDVIFVPTVIIHHLLGWFFIVRLGRIPKESRLLLFFPSLPIRHKENKVSLDGSPSSKIMWALFAGLRNEVLSGRVILGVETSAMKRAGEAIFGVSFTYFPHPVEPIISDCSNPMKLPEHSLTMACYGPARSEKGSDILARAIDQYLEKHPESRVHFVIQWMEDFQSPSGEMISLPDSLKNHPQVEIIDRYFKNGEYAERLASTDLLILPYRQSSYALRLSRVVVEAMVNGIPVLVTRGTTLEDQAKEYGEFFTCVNEDVESLVASIEEGTMALHGIMSRGRASKRKACNHFSVAGFREIILKTG